MNSSPILTSSSRRIALFASHLPGLDVARYLASSKCDQIVALCLCNQNPQIDKLILDECGLDANSVFIGKQDYSNPSVLERFYRLNPDVIICVYWPWLLPEIVYCPCDITINFHPAMLPANRGWYPHVHNLINGDSAGVTLHQLSVHPDSGPIWAQKEVDTLPTDTAFDLYMRLQKAIVELFLEKWPDIRDGKLRPFPQSESYTAPSYNRKNVLDEIDVIDLDAPTTPRKILNKLRARTFGNRGFAYFDDDQGRVYVRIELSRETSFE